MSKVGLFRYDHVRPFALGFGAEDEDWTPITPNSPVPVRGPSSRASASLLPSPSSLGIKTEASAQLMGFEDFEDGPQGWVQLYTQNLTTQCPMAWIKDRHKARIEIRTPDVAGYEGMAIRRYSTALGDGFHLVQWLASIHEWDAVSPRPNKGPKWFEWAIDAAKDDGTRNYFAVKYIRNATGLNVAGTPTDVSDKIMVSTYSGGTTTFHDMGAFAWPVNESKCLPVPISLLVNTATGKYHGLAVGRWIRKGVFGANPSELSGLPAAGGPNLPRFSSGFNSLFVVNNLDGSGLTEGVAELLAHRAIFLGGEI